MKGRWKVIEEVVRGVLLFDIYIWFDRENGGIRDDVRGSQGKVGYSRMEALSLSIFLIESMVF